MDDVIRMTAREQSRLIRERRVSPVELTRASLDRIETWDGALRAWITVDAERALAAARRAEAEIARGDWRGPLHGLPYGVKDQMHAEGFPTTLGTRVLDEAETAPPGNAAVIARLDAAGAILLGKQNLHEFGKGGTISFPYGEPRNPWNPAYSPSSSSSGSGIAPAACMCAFSIGEDTGGSIRGPAALNGLVGLRPTHGLVSRRGAVMAAYTSDTIGPLARSVADCADVLTAIAGFDPADPLSIERPREDYGAALERPVAGMRVAVVREIAEAPSLHDEVREAFARALDALRDLGAIIESVSLPLARFAVPLQLLSADADVASWFLATHLRDRYDRFDVGTRTRLAAASLIPATVYNRAMRARVLLRRELLDAAKRFDALVSPTMLTPNKRIEDTQERVEAREEAVTRLMERRIGVYPFSVANVPALAVPMGFCGRGLPLSIQFAAKPFDEAALFALAAAYEAATGWTRETPDLARTVATAA